MHKGLLMALAVAVPGAALAANAPQRDEELQMRTEARERARSSMSSEDDTARNFTVRGMGGPMSYTGDAARLTTPGATYGVNAGWDFARNLGAEVGYQGQAYSSEPSPGGVSSPIMENGGQALAKVRTDVGNFEPYAVGGLNVSRLNVVNDAATAGAIQDNTLFRLPVGAGVDYRIPSSGAGNVAVGVRGLYQLGLDKGAFPVENNASSSSQLMGVASVGGNW